MEVTSLITASGPLPLNVAPFPEDTLRLLQLMKSFERLTIEAALTGNRHTAWRALMLESADRQWREARTGVGRGDR